jgi:hypothetical protein
MQEYKTASQLIEENIGQKCLVEHKLIYDSAAESIEPIYFFILDLMQDEFGYNVEKIIDNFTSSPSSGHFGELGQRATIMQQQGTKILGDINTVLRSILNIIYDLRDFRTRLQYYKDVESSKKEKSEAARLALKQLWIDKVDSQKGNSSISVMARQLGFQTLFDAFYVSKNEDDVKKLDLNDRVKRMVLQRIEEFNIWLYQSGQELKKRYEIEKIYLKSQINSLKIYSRWVKPYLKTASKLEMKDIGRNPSLVDSFSTLFLELTLLGKKKLNIENSAISEKIPFELKNYKSSRDYYSCVLVDFNFRGFPQRVSQRGDYNFGGRTEVTFKGYSLNEDELKKLDEELKKSDIYDSLNLIEGTTTESIDNLKGEIESFLEEEIENSSKEEKQKLEKNVNPFLAIIGYYNKKNEKKEISKIDKIKKDNWIEKNHLRRAASEEAKAKAFKFFDIYKKAHGMPTPE